MEFSVKSGNPEKQRTACLVLGVYESRRLTPPAEQFDTAAEGFLGNVLRRGDLDLALGNDRQPNRMYLNDGGRLSSAPAWASSEIARTLSVAWGDVDGDGDQDLAVLWQEPTVGTSHKWQLLINNAGIGDHGAFAKQSWQHQSSQSKTLW